MLDIIHCSPHGVGCSFTTESEEIMNKNKWYFLLGIIFFLLFHILPIVEGGMKDAPVWYWCVAPLLFGAAGIGSGNFAEITEKRK